MDKWNVARHLNEIARYLELTETNPFKSRAFERAARRVESLETDIAGLLREGTLYSTPGIGKAIGPIIEELVKSGTSRYLEELRAKFPPGIFELLRVPGLGLRKIGQLHSELGIGSIDELEAACRAGKLTSLRGFGAKTQQKILDGIGAARQRQNRFLLPTGLEVAGMMRERLAGIAEVLDAEITGSVRRRLEVIQNVDIALAVNDPAALFATIGKRQILDDLQWEGERMIRGIVRDDVAVRFHVSAPEDFGANVLQSTGSSDFVEALSKSISRAGYAIEDGTLRKNGRRIKAASEHDLFEKIGVAFVEPERREDGTDLARKKRVVLVQPADIRGTFHVHTTFSDGRNTVREMLDSARERDYEYVGISDHSKAAYYAGGLTEDRLREQHAEIDRHREAVAPMRVFRGTEADILPDGTIDYGAETLDLFDFVVASIHSQFGMSKDQMTERILTAMDDPHVTFLGHLTGRLLLSRDGYQVDYDRIFDKAAERGVIIEINGNPRRLDVDWRHLRRAVDRGVLFSIHPDAHSIREMSHIISGAWVARKGGLSARHIFNTRGVAEVEAHFVARRRSPHSEP